MDESESDLDYSDLDYLDAVAEIEELHRGALINGVDE